MDIKKHLVLIKGEDKTKDVRSFRHNNGRVDVTFTNGKTYPYAKQNFELYKDPDLFLPSEGLLLRNDSVISNANQAYFFAHHVRVIYNSGYSDLFDRRQVKIVRSCLEDKKSKNCFEYLKHISRAVGLKDEKGFNILASRYDKINFVREDSVLAPFLSGRMQTYPTRTKTPPVYPFGLNNSQKTAVEKALLHPLSIIEGPPGTGKTQTILNLIANAVMNGESIAVVSSNNEATGNVRDKLKKAGLDFICAYLGNTDNKTAFIENQSSLPDLSTWQLQKEQKQSLHSELQDMLTKLNDMLEKKNALSALRQELEAVKIEYGHFENACANTLQIKTIQNLNSDRALELWLVCEERVALDKPIGFLARLKLFFRFGKNAKFINIYGVKETISACKNQYYLQKNKELEKQLDETEKQLSSYSFDRKMKEYADISMKLFHAALYEKYTKHERRLYEADDLWKNSEQFMKDYPVVLSTTYSLRSSLSNDAMYDYVIVDEASQVDLATGALALSCAKKAVIVGDLKQLPNVVDTATAKITDNIFEKFDLPEHYRYSNHSLLLTISELFSDIPKTLLREHYRCHPKIIEFCNRKFYNGELIILTEPKSERLPLIVYKTTPGNHERERVNFRQIEVIRDEIIPRQNIKSTDCVGIVTPYRNQTNALQKAFADTEIKADTVDKFQGRENDIIILSTVDNEIGEFTDNANRLNVAISRAIHQLIVVVNGNEERKDTNIGDLIDYIQYNNFEIIESEISSVFDYLFKAYAEKRKRLLKGRKRISEYDSENIIYHFIQKVLSNEQFFKCDVISHIPLNTIFGNVSKLSDDETRYAMNPLTHVDFLIFNKFNKTPVLAIEVDGAAFHKEGSKQTERDKMKDEIFEKYGLPLLRFRTDESREQQRLKEILLSL